MDYSRTGLITSNTAALWSGYADIFLSLLESKPGNTTPLSSVLKTSFQAVLNILL